MGNISQKKKEINESPANKPPADEPPADEPPAKNLGEYERGKGKIIIIVNDEFKECDLISLPGSKKDIDVICDLFPKEKHDVVLLRNRTKEELLKELDEEIKKINGSEKDSYEFMAMFFSSHGGCQSANVQFKSSSGNATKVNAADINATDKKTTEVSIEYLFDTAGDRMFFFEDFVAKFNTSDDCCPRLKGKPKLFVFDNCRGSKENSLMRKAEEASTSEYRGKGPSIACQYPEVGEYMIFHATVKGAASYQYTNDGSFLITSLCDVVKKNPDKDLHALTPYVIKEVEEKCEKMVETEKAKICNQGIEVPIATQVCEVTTTLRKAMFVTY